MQIRPFDNRQGATARDINRDASKIKKGRDSTPDITGKDILVQSDVKNDEELRDFMVFHGDKVSLVKFDKEKEATVTTIQRPEPTPLGGNPPMQMKRLAGNRWVDCKGPWKGNNVAMLVHGLNGDSDSMLALGNHLAEKGEFDDIVAVDYNLGYRIDDLGKSLANKVKKNLSPDGRLKLFAHSMGGLVTRSAIENHHLDSRTDFLVTMGTPHDGARSAFVADNVLPVNVPEAKDLSTGSEFLKNLNDGQPVNVHYYAAIGTSGNFLTKYWTIKCMGEEKVAELLGDQKNDGMVASNSAGYDLSRECRQWDSKTFPVNHSYVRGGKYQEERYREVFQQIDRWLLSEKESRG